MKRLRLFVAMLCAVLIFTNIPVQTSAFERKDHDKYMAEVW